MELLVRQKRPLQDFSSGKWVNKQFPIIFYTIKDNKRLVITHMSEDVRSYVLTLTINNNSCIGKYNTHEDSLLFNLNMEDNNLRIKDNTRIEGLVLLERIAPNEPI
jgi:hypothetical protein